MHPTAILVLAAGVLLSASLDAAASIGEEFTPPPLPNPAWRSLADYGAVGDGVVDDSDALQRALDDLAGVKQLYLPAGTYRITRTLVARSVPDTYGNEYSRVVGADPASTTIRWAGPAGADMLWIDSMPYSSIERITFDGAGSAAEGILCEWQNSQPGTWMEFKDLAFSRLSYGIRATRNSHRMFAESIVRRCRFSDISQVGIEIASANNQNWFVWHSRFERCAVGVGVDGYREMAVYDSTFISSTVADLRGVNAARGCWSKDSRMFYLGTDHPIEPQISLQGNTVIDTIDATAIDATPGGWWMTHVIDNTIRSRAGNAGPAIRSNARTLAIGNVLTVSNGIQLGNANSTVLDTSVVTTASIPATEPSRPGVAVDYNRKVFSVFGDNRDRGAPGAEVQAAIDAAVAWEAGHPGSRPVVYLGNPMQLERPLVIPAGTDIQIMGKAYVQTIGWTGPDSSIIVIQGPTKVSLENLELVCAQYRTTSKVQDTRSAIRLEGCDTTGSRLLMDGCQLANGYAFTDGSRRRGIEADRVDHLRIEALTWFGGSVRITDGALDARAGVYLFGSANVTSHPAYEVINGGRLVVQEAYSELFDDLGAGEQGKTLYCHGIGNHPGEVVIDLYSNSASADITAHGLVNHLVGWSGRLTQLTNSYVVGHTRIEGPADGTALLTLAGNWPQADALPAGAKVLQTNMDFATVNQGVFDAAAFIRDGLALRRSATPTPQPLAAVPAGASDIQFRRLLIWGGTEDGIRVIGASAALAAAPAILNDPDDLTVGPGHTATFTVAASGMPSPEFRWQRRGGVDATWADIGGATSATYAFTASIGDDGAQFRAIASNANGTATTAPATLDVASDLLPAAIVSSPVTSGTSGVLYTYAVAAHGLPAPSLVLTAAPAWLNLVGGVLRGIPPSPGTVGPVTITASNGIGDPAMQTFNLTIAAPTSATVGAGGAGGGGGCGAGAALCGLLCGFLPLILRKRRQTT